MMKRKRNFVINIYKVFNILLLLLIFLPVIGFGQLVARNRNVSLGTDTHKIIADGYRIDEVTATTREKSIGQATGADGKPEILYFKEGTAKAIKAFISSSYNSTAAVKQIRLTIEKLYVTENIESDYQIKGKVDLQFGFDIITGDSLYAHLTDYKGSITYTRILSQSNVIEQYLKLGLENSQRYFNNWVLKNRQSNPLLANSIKLIITSYTERPEGDTIYYKTNRPLRWNDFQDRLKHNSHYSAEVIPGLGFTESNHVENSCIIIEMKLKVYLPKSAAWVRPGEENEYNLNHEQRHFDIVKVVAERLRKRLLSMQLPVFNYDGYINVAYFDALREITDLQKQYDLETGHVANDAAQQNWNKKIDAELTRTALGS